MVQLVTDRSGKYRPPSTHPGREKDHRHKYTAIIRSPHYRIVTMSAEYKNKSSSLHPHGWNTHIIVPRLCELSLVTTRHLMSNIALVHSLQCCNIWIMLCSIILYRSLRYYIIKILLCSIILYRSLQYYIIEIVLCSVVIYRSCVAAL